MFQSISSNNNNIEIKKYIIDNIDYFVIQQGIMAQINIPKKSLRV